MKKLLIPPVFVLISLVLICLFYFIIPEYNCIPVPYNFCGIIVSFAGFMIMGKVKELFKKHQTTLKFEKSSWLITESIFARTRNPMYIGMFLLLLGIGICFQNLFSILTPFGFILLIHLISVPKEERMMADAFGNEYLTYKKNVRRWI